MKRSFPLDLSGIIHLASRGKNHSSSYRFAANLTEEVNPKVLQQALDCVAPRFPTIAAGIRAGFLNYYVVPIEKAPKVLEDCELLATFTKKEIEANAFRVLYKEKTISLECFHALTDGYGAITFLKTLLAEYFKQLKGFVVPTEQMILAVEESAKQEEIIDDYYTYAKKGKKIETGKVSYQFESKSEKLSQIESYICPYQIKDLLAAAKSYQVSLNVYLTAVMLMTFAEAQRESGNKTPVQVMVPMNLRNLFPSKTLRNFVLVAYATLLYRKEKYTFEEVLSIVKNQLQEQMGKEHLEATMDGFTALERNPILRHMPLAVKYWAVKIGHYVMGLKKSCITMTNLGPIAFPETIANYIESVHVLLTPREASGYNCGIITSGEMCYINFTRLCKEPELENIFMKTLERVSNENIKCYRSETR